MNLTQVNPFYAGRVKRPASNVARLPLIPRNASPVPHLTSLYHFSDADRYGDRSYPGNCSGNITSPACKPISSVALMHLSSKPSTLVVVPARSPSGKERIWNTNAYRAGKTQTPTVNEILAFASR